MGVEAAADEVEAVADEDDNSWSLEIHIPKLIPKPREDMHFRSETNDSSSSTTTKIAGLSIRDHERAKLQVKVFRTIMTTYPMVSV
nr:hypothetical protein [Tanacetum cinerariifolium]